MKGWQPLLAREDVSVVDLLGGVLDQMPESFEWSLLSKHDTCGPYASDGEVMAPEELN